MNFFFYFGEESYWTGSILNVNIIAVRRNRIRLQYLYYFISICIFELISDL
jgi:hypothetical protein